MTEWVMKRFWTDATVAEAADGFAVHLDGRAIKTPAKSALIVPSQALAAAVAEEWQNQSDVVDPESMPITRLANSALDKVTPQFDAVVDHLVEYGGSDLLCYRADRPDSLIARQAAEWDPLLAWAQTHHGISLALQTGIMPIDQPQDALSQMRDLTHAMSPFHVAGFHELVTISGSWIIGYAAFVDAFLQDRLWAAACLDELFQAEQWGEDAEAEEIRTRRQLGFATGRRFVELLGSA